MVSRYLKSLSDKKDRARCPQQTGPSAHLGPLKIACLEMSWSYAGNIRKHVASLHDELRSTVYSKSVRAMPKV